MTSNFTLTTLLSTAITALVSGSVTFLIVRYLSHQLDGGKEKRGDQFTTLPHPIHRTETIIKVETWVFHLFYKRVNER